MFSFDPDKDKANIKKHGVSLAEAEWLEWDEALTWQDDREDYGEVRLVALAPIADRLYCCVYVERGEDQRIISLRKANNRERMLYASTSDD